MEWRADLSVLFENTADGVWVSGPEGRILFWNRAAETILGYPAAQVVGQPCREVFDGWDCNGNRLCAWPCPVKMQLREGEMVNHFDMSTQTKAGKAVWLDVSCLSVPNTQGQVPTVVHLFRDVTVAHQTEVLVRERLAAGKPSSKDEKEEEEDLTLNSDLSQRELQVVNLLRAGATTAAIADELFISRTTVRNHIQNIFSKLKVHTRLEAVAYVNQIAQRTSAPVAAPPVETRRRAR